jgi:hypothetical protein
MKRESKKRDPSVSRCTKTDVRCTYCNDLIINTLQKIIATFI